MTTRIEGLALDEREEPYGRVRLALVDDSGELPRDVCALTIDELTLHDGTGKLVRVDGIGNVATMDSHRRRGLASALLRVAIEHMRNGDAAGSLLYGIDDFYEPFGWRSWGDERWVRVAIGDPSDSVDDDHGARPMRDDDREAVARSYEQIAARVPGAAARTCGRAWAQLDVADVTVVERDGAIVGWAWFGRDRVPERDAKQARVPAEVVVAELQAVDEQAMLDVVAVARKRARLDGERPDATMLVVGAPEAHPLRVLARAGRIECALVDEVRLTGGPMLLPFDERGEALAAIAAPYQFLPDRF